MTTAAVSSSQGQDIFALCKDAFLQAAVSTQRSQKRKRTGTGRESLSLSDGGRNKLISPLLSLEILFHCLNYNLCCCPLRLITLGWTLPVTHVHVTSHGKGPQMNCGAEVELGHSSVNFALQKEDLLTAGTVSYTLPVCQAKSDCGGFAGWEWETSYFLLVVYSSVVEHAFTWVLPKSLHILTPSILHTVF